MMLCKACSIGKAKQLAINKHVDDSKKVTRSWERMSQGRQHKIAVLLQPIKIGTFWWYTEYQELQYYHTKSYFVNMEEIQ